MRLNLRKIALASGVLFCFVLILALAAISSFLNSDAARQSALGYIQSTLKGRLMVGSHRVDLVAGRLVLSDVRLDDLRGETIAEATRLLMQIRWLSLIRRTVHISRVHIENPLLSVAYDAQDDLNLLQILPGTNDQEINAPHGQAGWPIRVDDFQVSNARVLFRRPATGWLGRAEQIGISAGGDLERRTGHIRMAVGRVEGQFEQMQGAMDDIVLSARYLPDPTSPIRFSLATPRSKIDAEGRLGLEHDHPEATAVVHVDLDLAELQPWLSGAGALQGRATAKITLDGGLDDPGAALALNLSHARGWDTSVRSLTLDALLARRVVDIERLDAEDEWGRIQLSGQLDLRPVFPHSFRQTAAGWQAAGLQLAVNGKDLRPERLPALAVPWQGVWQSRIRVQGVVGEGWNGNGQAEIDLRVAQLEASGLTRAAEQGTLAAYLRWSGGRIGLDSCQVTLGDSTLEAEGTLDWGQRHIDAQATLRAEQIANLGALFDTTLPHGRALLKADLQGALDRPRVHGALLAENVALAPWRFGRVLAEGALAPDGLLQVTRLVLENDGSYVEGQGSIGLKDSDGHWHSDPGVDGDFDLSNVRLSSFYSGLDVDLTLNGRLGLKGSSAHPRAELSLDNSPVRWRDLKGAFEGRLLYEDGDLAVPTLRLASGRSDIQLQGTVAFRDRRDGSWLSDPVVQADVTSATLNLADFGKELNGTVTLEADVSGSLSQLRGAYRLAGRDLDLRHQKLAAVLLEGGLADERVTLERMVVSVARGQEISARGWYAFDRRFEAELNTDGLELRHIDRLQAAGPVDGQLLGSARANGTLDRPQLAGRFWIREPKIHGRPWDDFRLDLALQEQRLTIDADLTFAFKANYHLKRGDFDLTALLDGTDLGPYLALAADARWQGRLSGRLQASGNVHHLEKMAATVQLSDGELRFRETNVLDFHSISAELSDGMLVLPETRMRLMQDGYLSVSAAGPLHRDLAVTMDGVIPLAAVAPFSDAVIDASGTVDFQVQGRGALDRMRWEGEVGLEQLGCRLVDLGQTLHAVNGRLLLAPGQVTIETLSGRIEEGDFSIQGAVHIADMQPTRADVRIEARALPLVWPETMDVKIGADLTLKGDASEARLQGRLVLLEGTYYRDFKLNLLSVITETQRPEPLPSQWQAPEWMAKIRLDVVVAHRYPLLVDNNVARLEVAPDLKLTGSVAQPLLDGRAQVTAGEIIFRKRSFAVTRGVVDFVNPYRIEPILDLQAESQIRQWRVRLTAQGPPQQLKIQLSSDPPESDANILSLIVFGQTSSELSGTGGGTTTGQMLAALVASTWGEDIQKETGLDILEVETGSDVQGDERIELTVGKKLTSRLTLKYALESKNNQLVQRAISEYRLLEHMSASGFQDTAGNYGGELLLRIEFR